MQAGYVYDLFQLLKHTPEACYMTALGSIIQNVRNELVEYALRGTYSHVLFVDSDMRFPSYSIDSLLSRNRAIIGVNATQRGGLLPTAVKSGQRISSKNKTGEEEVDVIGFGLVLVEMSVFHDLKRPWFEMLYDPVRNRSAGEDVYFCANARDAGYSVWIDHDLSQKVKHVDTIDLPVV